MKFRKGLRENVYEETDGKCFYCRKELPEFGPDYDVESTPTLDHVIPASIGGSNGRANVVLSCRRCNEIKDDWIIPGYIWRDHDALIDLLTTGVCKYGEIKECCGNQEMFKPRTKQELTEILWNATLVDSNRSLTRKYLTTSMV